MLDIDSDGEAQIFMMNFIITGVTSSIAKTLAAPIDRMKLILQNQSSALQILTGKRTKYKGFLDGMRRLPKEQGFRSFWRGNGTNLLRYIPTQALNFSFNDFFKGHLQFLVGEGSHAQSPLLAYMSGGLSGACTVFTVYPVKFCQTKLSVDMGPDHELKIDGTAKKVEREYRGFIDCLVKVCKKEGIIGLYKGFTLAILGAVTYRALYFGLFDNFKQMYAHHDLQVVENNIQSKPSLLVEFAFAQSVTTTAGLVTYPFDTVGRRLMLDSGREKELKVFKGTWDAFKVMYTNEGFSSFYRGALTNCMRGICGALVLVIYDEILYFTKWKDKMVQNNRH